MKVHADMYNFLGPDIPSEIPLETYRNGMCIGHVSVIKHLKALREWLDRLQLCWKYKFMM